MDMKVCHYYRFIVLYYWCMYTIILLYYIGLFPMFPMFMVIIYTKYSCYGLWRIEL